MPKYLSIIVSTKLKLLSVITTSLLSIAFFFPTSISATTYYISPNGSDSGAGTSSSPWKSLSYACSQVPAGTHTIHVNAGTYTETTRCDLKIGVSIEGEGLTSVLKSRYIYSNDTYAYISLISSSYGTNGNQSISNLKLDGDNLTGSSAIRVYRRSNVKLHDLTIVDFKYNAISIEEAPADWGSGPPSAFGKGNEIYNSTITNCTGEHDSGGYGMLNITSQEGMLIHDNTLTQTSRPQGNNGNIMTGTHNKGMKFYNNISHKPDFDGSNWNFHIEHGNTSGGMEIYNNEFYGGDCPIDPAGVSSNTNVKGSYQYSWYIHHNLFTGNPTQTIEGKSAIGIEGPKNEDFWIYYNHFKNLPEAVSIIGWKENSSVQRIYIRYNLFEDMGWSNWTEGTIDIASYTGNPVNMGNIYIENNVFTMKAGTNMRAVSIVQNSPSSISSLYIRNNIFTGSTRGAFLVANSSGTINGLFINNNILFNNVNNNNPTLGSNVTNYQFNNNLKVDPKFINATTGDFRLQSTSPAINAGVSTGLTKDYAGNSIIGNPDIGAYEYQSGGSQTPTPTSTSSPKPGDINGDGSVNALDILKVLQEWGTYNASHILTVLNNWGR